MTILTVTLLQLAGIGTQADTLQVMFWNLENFFDWRVDSTSTSTSDKEFSSFGSRHWTRRRFLSKCNAIAKTVLWTTDRQGSLPDVIGVAEVENRFVLQQLLKNTQLRKLDYSIIHYDSPDPRGIDVALLYRSSRLKLLNSKPFHVMADSLRTRDILQATFCVVSSEPPDRSITFLVNHHPSKYGGSSDSRRIIALKRLRSLTDSLQQAGLRHIVAMGDFNDTPDNPAFGILTMPLAGDAPEGSSAPLTNLSSDLAARGKGTIRYEGKWDLIDMFFVSRSLLGLPGASPPLEMQILEVPFLTVRDTRHAGEKPLRTYSGPRYLGGVSDHRPIVLAVPLGD